MEQGKGESEHILAVDFVDTEYFLRRIYAFEQQYGMEWGVFLANYSTGRYKDDACQNPDYAEWAFLCNNFMSELIGHDYNGPPGNAVNPNSEKPEADSGFFILWRDNCSTWKSTMRTSSKCWTPAD
jgi:hypothetical protein